MDDDGCLVPMLVVGGNNGETGRRMRMSVDRSVNRREQGRLTEQGEAQEEDDVDMIRTREANGE